MVKGAIVRESESTLAVCVRTYILCIDIMAMLERNLIESYFAKCTSSIRTKAMIGSWNNAKSLRAHIYDRRMQIKHCRKRTNFGKEEFQIIFVFFTIDFYQEKYEFPFPFFFCCRLPRDKPEIVVTFMNFADLDSTTN